MRIATAHRSSLGALALLIASALSGCWTPPVANVQPKGPQGLIQEGIAVESVKSPGIVQSVDHATRTLILSPGISDKTTRTVKVGSEVSNFDKIKPGDNVQARIAETLAVYVLHDGKAPGAGGTPEAVPSDAKVLSVDPSYRLLTLEYPDGRQETMKVSRDVKLSQMESGNDVVIRSGEAVGLRVCEGFSGRVFCQD